MSRCPPCCGWCEPRWPPPSSSRLTYQLVRSLQHTDLGVVSFFSYFTVLSNVGAAVVLGVLAVRP